MKKLIVKAAILILPIFVLPALLDPYNVFHYRAVRDNGVEPAKNYIKMRYLLDNPKKFTAYLFGSSRVGGIDVGAISGLRWYNMTYSGGVPHEHLANFSVMIKNGIIPDTVMIGVDDIACYTSPEAHKTQLLRTPFPVEAPGNKAAYAGFLVKYCTPIVLGSLPIILSHKKDNRTFRKQFYENGGRSIADDIASLGKFDWQKVPPIAAPTFTQTDSALADIQGIITLCAAHNITLIVFTNPLHVLTYTAAVKRGYIDFLERLSGLTCFYNFSGVNDVTTNNDNYRETSHYRLNVGDMIIDRVFNDKVDEKLLSQGFGYYVTPENRAALLDMLRKQVE
jgi:hypothetical protein